MAENRIPRENQTREASARKKAWVRPELLPSPRPVEGYKFRWVRVATNNDPDARNISEKLREGWVPVKASEHPEIELVGGPENPRFAENVVIGGLMLCKAPVEMVEARDQHFQEMARLQTQGADEHYFRQTDHRVPVFRNRKSSFGVGGGAHNNG